MRIVHLCLSCFYIDGYNYQENVIPRINKEDGNDVLIIASTETYTDDLHLGYVEPSTYITEFGVPIIRLPYKRIITQFISAKIRGYVGLYEELEKFKPDVIFSHDLCYLSLYDVIRYKKKYPDTKFYADTHTAKYNSGTNWLSLNVLHRLFYRHIIQKAVPYLNRYFYIGEAEQQFSLENYLIPEKLMEFYPLGGTILSEDIYQKNRFIYRKKLGVDENDIVCIHTGKLHQSKRTEELIQAFSSNYVENLKMVIIGSIPPENKEFIESLIAADNRISYLGWKNSEELAGYICASDLYCQPGSVSATLQNAICYRCAIMSYPHKGYKQLDTGNFIWVETECDMRNTFYSIGNKSLCLDELKANSMICSQKYLDYKKIAAVLYD